TGMASWTGGKIAIGWHNGTDITVLTNTTDFTLAVNFTDGELTASDVDLGSSRTLSIAGDFAVGSTGVTGETTLKTTSGDVTATIRGVIGTEGVLAVFATNDTVTSGFYAGGFVVAADGLGTPSNDCGVNPFTASGCSAGEKETFCTVTDIFNASCFDGTHGQVNTARDTYCRAVGRSPDDADCRRVGLKATICAAGDKPFSDICGTNVDNQRTFCRANLSDGLCTSTISTFCTNPVPASDIYDVLCDTGYGTQRLDYCQDARTDISEATNNCAIDLVAICTTSGGTAPFSGICGTNVANQRIFCRANLSNGLCTNTISTFCTNPATASDIYDDLCDIGYSNERLSYCRLNAP
ncbi:MAG: hypothetical protein K8953_02800, partial [Proteobacteria bacterium]|nr:hypothetical protein [Pseudomonadota bacterium]